MQTYHNKTVQQTAELLGTDIKTGLTHDEVKKRLHHYGKNELIEKKKKNIFIKFLEQFNDFMIIILLSAAAVSFITSIMQGDADITEPVIILAIVILNALLGVIQEKRAEKSLEALKKLSSPHACVLRNGNELNIPAANVVPGDILIISAGDLVAADCRLVTSNNLTTDESSLTGESVNAEKDASVVLEEFTALGDRKNIILSSTSVTAGKATAIVTGTGMNTEVGHIANMLLDDETPQTPLQLKLADTGKTLGIAALFVCLFIFIVGLFRHLPPFDMFMTAVSLAVAAIPEGLPAIVTIMLAIGVMRMSKHNAIVRNLPSVETLGSASVICSDKTGTLTQNKMTVTSFYTYDEKKLIRLCSMCCDCAEGHKSPTESAILAAAKKHGFDKSVLDKKYRRIAEIPFDSTRKRMTTMHRDIKGYKTIIKGALEFVLPLCTDIYNGQKAIPLTSQSKRKIVSENSKMTSDGLRVIAVCYRDDYTKTAINENNMVFIGLIGIEAPPRKEAKQSVELCKRAGIRPIMITGDHAETALSVAKKIGIADDNSKVMTGDILEKISDNELALTINQYNIFARVTPSHKMKIVKALKANGEIVAMTGDGVNDAPALKQADIGVAMGITGSEVSKDAAAMVLTDDNFATIIKAVENGRNVYKNIKGSIQFLLSGNFGGILAVLYASLAGLPVPFAPVHLLFINLLTDSLPAIALGLEPHTKTVMDEKPRPMNESILTKDFLIKVGTEGFCIGLMTMLAFLIGYRGGDAVLASTMAFGTLCTGRLVHGFNCKSDRPMMFSKKLWNNIYLIGAFLIGFVLITSVLTIPALQNVFKVVPLNVTQLFTVYGLALLNLPVIQLLKWIRR